MSEDTPTQDDAQAAAVQAEFDAVVNKLEAGESISAEEGLKLLKILGGVNANLTICNEMLYSIHEQLPQMVENLGRSVARRCGRSDRKLLKAVDKLSAEYVEHLWNIVRIRGIDVANAMRQPQEETNEA